MAQSKKITTLLKITNKSTHLQTIKHQTRTIKQTKIINSQISQTTNKQHKLNRIYNHQQPQNQNATQTRHRPLTNQLNNTNQTIKPKPTNRKSTNNNHPKRKSNQIHNEKTKYQPKQKSKQLNHKLVNKHQLTSNQTSNYVTKTHKIPKQINKTKTKQNKVAINSKYQKAQSKPKSQKQPTSTTKLKHHKPNHFPKTNPQTNNFASYINPKTRNFANNTPAHP